MWIMLGLGAAGYFLYREFLSDEGSLLGKQVPGTKLVDGVRYFNADGKTAVLSAVPLLALVQETEVQGAKTFRLVAPFTGSTSAGEVITQSINNGMIVAASISLLNTNVEEHYVTIAFPTPGMREVVAGPDSPLALLFDPSHPAE